GFVGTPVPPLEPDVLPSLGLSGFDDVPPPSLGRSGVVGTPVPPFEPDVSPLLGLSGFGDVPPPPFGRPGFVGSSVPSFVPELSPSFESDVPSSLDPSGSDGVLSSSS